jgi:hypothetical protein
MDNCNTLPVIAGVEITLDSEGRYNLNALHKASGLGANKAPAQWLRTQQAQEFINEIITMQICTVPVNAINGGMSPGTFAHELVAIEYAGWISPSFRIKVNQTFIDYHTGKLQFISSSVALPYQPALEIQVLESVIRELRVSETSKIRMYIAFCKSNNINSDFLPEYVNEPLVRAITPLLKEMGSDLSSKVARTVNPALEAMGILVHLSRNSKSKGIKKFWSLTEEGLKYGRNETSPSDPRETQPLFFVDRFPELLARLEAYLDEQKRRLI